MHIAIIGCGQLSRMLALAGIPMGISFSFLCNSASEDIVCVNGLGTVVRLQPDYNAAELYKALGKPDCVTVEKEQLDVALVKALEAHCIASPSSKAVSVCQHRYREKQLLTQLDIPSAAYTFNTSAHDSAAELGLPLIAKSCSDGYDGKNQWRLKTQEDVQNFDKNHRESNLGDFIIEQTIGFSREVSLVSARSRNGEIRHYPLAENEHQNGILKQSVAPALQSVPKLAKQAETYMEKILNELDYVGVLAMECFEFDDKLLVNELAPRVHNSGHWTQLGSTTSQFESHVRAISGLALGRTDCHGVAGMINLIGNKQSPLDALTEQSSLHWYNKGIRIGRKLGHVNFIAADYSKLEQQLANFYQKTDNTDESNRY